MAQRVLFTPRTLAWVVLEVAAAPKGARPGVLVLRPGLTSGRDLLAELERYLSERILLARSRPFPDSVREAVKAKTA